MCFREFAPLLDRTVKERKGTWRAEEEDMQLMEGDRSQTNKSYSFFFWGAYA